MPPVGLIITLVTAQPTYAMIHLITSDTDRYFNFLTEDPVRPTIPTLSRIGINRDIFVLRDENGEAQAITCVSYQDSIPTTEQELFAQNAEPNIAVFYTIWSYAPGAGRTLIFNAVSHIKENMPNIKRFVTLSPPTTMARRFHLKNGALVFRENVETVNYEYIA
jgi:uncharacterized protein YuzE